MTVGFTTMATDTTDPKTPCAPCKNGTAKANPKDGCATRIPAGVARAATLAKNMSHRDLWYDRGGNPITPEAWSILHDDFAYVMVAKTPIGDDAEVSTVWVGLDHNFLGEGPPLIFETMIFGSPLDGHCWRYPNEVAALAGHDQAVASVRDLVR
jgi:hypothetical protein